MKNLSDAEFISKDYLTALQAYWEGRPQTAIEHLSMCLADEPTRFDRGFLYRLWIEILADLEEYAALLSLGEHLLLISLMNPECSETYAALRGMIHFEVGEFTGAQLYAKSVQNTKGNNYVDELHFRLKQRVHPDAVNSKLSQNIDEVTDYFHLKTVLEIGVRRNDQVLINKSLKQTKKLFVSAPMEFDYFIHSNIERQDYHSASKYATQLAELYSTNFDVLALAGYALCKDKQFDAAIVILENALNLGADSDVDINSLLSVCYGELSKLSHESSHHEKFEYYSKRTSEMLEALGMNNTYENYLNATSPYKIDAAQSPKPWLVKLNTTEFHDLRRAPPEEKHTMLYAIDKDAKPGDVVIFAGDDYLETKSSWRMAAVYRVTSSPIFDPISGFECHLALVSRPEVAIPFPIKLQNDDSVSKGVIECDEGALETISNAISEFEDLDAGPDLILREFERTRMSS